MTTAVRRLAAVSFALATLPFPASAHLVSTRFGDFYTGLLHPLTAFENALPWLALALLAGLQPVRQARWLLPVFPLTVAVGAVLATVSPALSGIATVNAGSFVLLGALVAFARELRPNVLLVIGGLLGLTHGYDNGLAFVRGGNLLLFIGGVASAGYLVVALAMACTHTLTRSRAWGSIAIRAIGSWIAAIGIMMAGLSLAPS